MENTVSQRVRYYTYATGFFKLAPDGKALVCEPDHVMLMHPHDVLASAKDDSDLVFYMASASANSAMLGMPSWPEKTTVGAVKRFWGKTKEEAFEKFLAAVGQTGGAVSLPAQIAKPANPVPKELPDEEPPKIQYESTGKIWNPED